MKKINEDILNPYNRFFYILQSGLWLSYGLIFRSLWVGLNSHPPPMTWIFLYGLGGMIASNILSIFYWKNRDKNLSIQIAVAIMGSIFLALFWRFGINYFEFHYLSSTPLQKVGFMNYLIGGMTSFIHLLAWSAGYLFIAYYLKFQKEREYSILLTLQSKEAQIKQLHQQISPHFLFNVLHSLDTLLMKENITKSREMVSNLSRYLRASLSQKSNYSVSFFEEVTNARCYLDIEIMRFGRKLDVQWQLDDTVNEFQVPSLILQPLIENAIKHSLDKSLHGGQIKIKSESLGDKIEISVLNCSNDILGEGTNAKSLGIGLDNIRERLDLFYDGNAELKTNQLNENSFIATMVIKINND